MTSSQKTFGELRAKYNQPYKLRQIKLNKLNDKIIKKLNDKIIVLLNNQK